MDNKNEQQSSKDRFLAKVKTLQKRSPEEFIQHLKDTKPKFRQFLENSGSNKNG